MQQAARIPRRAARHPGCRGQAVLPDGDLLAGERVELPYTPVRPDEPADQVLAVLRGAETDILLAFQRSIHSLTVISPAAGSFQCARADLRLLVPSPDESCLLVSKPDSLASPPGTLYLTRHGRGPLPRFSAYATALPPLGCSFLRPGSGSGCLVWAVASAGCYVCGSRVAGHPRPRSARCRHH